MKSPDVNVRRAAAEAIGLILMDFLPEQQHVFQGSNTAQAMVQQMRKSLLDPDEQVRYNTCLAIGRAAKFFAVVLPDLVEALEECALCDSDRYSYFYYLRSYFVAFSLFFLTE